MRVYVKWLGLMLWFASPLTLADPPFSIQGLHLDLSTAAAKARAVELGGVCAADPRARASDNFRMHCEFLPCLEKTAAGKCRTPDRSQPSLTIAGQIVVRIGLEAQEADAPLERIAILFEGDHLAVAEALTRQYGEPVLHGKKGEKSWTHSRRMSWSQSGYRMGLLNSPHLILLAKDPQPSPASNATPR